MNGEFSLFLGNILDIFDLEKRARVFNVVNPDPFVYYPKSSAIFDVCEFYSAVDISSLRAYFGSF
jgi:hypothetical protein